MPISVFEMQVPETQVVASQPSASLAVRAVGQASSVPPLKKASAPLAASDVTCVATWSEPTGYSSTATSSMSVPSMACWKPSS
jgi:hypothetical protein